MNPKSLKLLAAVSMVSLMLAPGAARAQQSAYFNAINNLNPAGYWPMHEVAAPAQGDIETNYGTAGLAGTGYYPDWAGANGNIIERQTPGALADDPDQSVFFAKEIVSGSTVSFVNALVVPHTSPVSTLNPPFSVECWYFPTNTAAQDVWGQNGFEGLNAGNAGAGVGSICGLRFTFGGGAQSFIAYGFDNSTTLNSLVSSAAEAASNWYHLVLTCDVNTNFTLYVNGNSVSTAAGAGKYSPDYWTPLTIGSGRGGTRAIAGFLDEFAVYTNAISGSDVSQHYFDGTNGPDGAYFHDVTNDNAVIYLRMDAPNYSAPAVGTWPVLYNFGKTNGVAIGNGVYTPGTVPGVLTNSPVAINGVPFGGVSNMLAGLSGVSSFGDAGYAAAFNPTGSNANFTVTALFRGDPCDNRIQSIVGRGTNSWQLSMTTNGCIIFNAGNGNKAAGGTGQAAGDVSTRGIYNDGNWHEVVAVNQTNVVSIYVDGALDTNGTPSGVATTNTISGNARDVMIGSDPVYTNNPAGVGRNFAGQICEVAFFTNALTAGQVQTVYNASGVAPTIRGQPQSYAVNAGTDFTNMAVTVNGSGPLIYQWYTNGVALAGQTASNLVLNPVTANEASLDYYVIVQNAYGSATSAVASLTVYSAPLFTSALPVTYDTSNNTNYLTLYAGANPAFRVAAAGAQPIAYYWFTNGVNVAGQNGTNFVLADVQSGTINVACAASNFVGTNAIVWSATVIADPLNGSGGPAPYPQQVLAGNPIGYWRLNDLASDGDNQNGDDGFVAHDYAGGNDGLYTNIYLNVPGYSSTDPSDTAAETGDFGGSFPSIANNLAGWIEGIDFAAANGTNAEFTVEAWAKAQTDQQSSPGAIVTEGKYGISDSFNLGLDTQSTHNYQFYVRNAAGTEFAADSTIAPDGNWHHLVGVCDEANGVIALYVDGHLQKTNSIPTASGLFEANAPMTIGAGTANGVNYSYQFIGDLNDVAVFNDALTASNVASQYISLGYAPTISPAPPTTAGVNGGGTLVIPAIALGTPRQGYYWYDEGGGTNVAAGTSAGAFLNATLTVSNVPGAWNGDTLELVVTNAYGQNTYSVVLTVNTNAAIITLQLPSPVTVLQGNSYTYSIGADGVTPIAYQWYNGGSVISGATNASYTMTAGAPGSTSYSVTVSNEFGGLASAASEFVSVSRVRPTLTSGFATNLMLLEPAGYWPMHENQSPAAGDIEANYGSLGVLGAAYYPDWTLVDGSTNAFARQSGGALANDPDTALHFTQLISSGSGAGTWTNELYVSHTSPLATLTPPFSVECWFYPTNSGGGSSAQSVWGQHGFEALNDGYAGSGNGPYAGIQLNYNGSFQVYVYSNGTQIATASSGNAAINQWHHLVAACDAGTNITLYLDGVASSTVAAAGEYMLDYWTPLTIGGTRGGTRSCAGSIDEFAVYTNALQQGDVTAHYNAGLSGGPGQYFADVMASNPAIYLRMDAPPYTRPPTNTWPVLFNYGSSGTNGLYTPGTVPGVVSGPTFAGFGGATVAQLSGVSSFADAGYAAALNPTGSNVDFSVAATFRGNPCDNRVQTIAGHGTNSWQLSVTTNGCVVFNAGNGNSTEEGTGQDAGDIRTTNVYNDGNWHQVVAVNQANVASIYVDGKLDTSGTANGVITTSVIPGNTNDVMIAADPSYIDNPAGVGRQFAGQVCEVAFFTNALNAGEVRALYAAATSPNTIPAYVAPEPPLNATVAAGATLTVTAGAAGTSNVGYTWQINTNGGGSSVLATGAGAAPLNANLTVGSVPIAWNGGQLELTVTNAYGTNIAFVNLSVVNPVSAVPPKIGFSFADNQLTLSWPPDHLGWTLEAQTNSLSVGINTNWVPITSSSSATNIVITVNPANGTVFYRLVYP